MGTTYGSVSDPENSTLSIGDINGHFVSNSIIGSGGAIYNYISRGSDFSNIKMPYGGNTALNDAEFMKLEQMYNQAANATGLNSTNPFMQTMPHTINQNNFSTLP